uniref:Putative cholesterol transport protein n=1 Tax=Ixodes ricinus TaxID=34613 RepID=A0A090XDR7_IXORI
MRSRKEGPTMGTLVVALCALLATQIFARVDGAKCIMRGACDQDGIRGSCPYDGEPQVIDKPEARALLEGICGDVFANSSQPLRCDADQLDDFHENFESARVLGLDNCPACSVNFRALLCSMTCSPRQSDFLRLIKTAVNEEDKTTHVAEIDYHLTPSFANGLFDSCVDTRSRIASIPLLNFMCGKWASELYGRTLVGLLGLHTSERRTFAVRHQLRTSDAAPGCRWHHLLTAATGSTKVQSIERTCFGVLLRTLQGCLLMSPAEWRSEGICVVGCLYALRGKGGDWWPCFFRTCAAFVLSS